MPSVDSDLAAWLKSESLEALATSAGIAWGNDRTVEVDYLSPLDDKADATDEAARILALMQGPNVKDIVLVPGRRRDLMGKVVTVTFNRLGYDEDGKNALVVGVAENPENGTSALTILRRVTPPPPDSVLLLEGAAQVSGEDGILLEGTAQLTGNDVLAFYGDE